MLAILLLVVLACLSSPAHGAGCGRRVCYHTNWSQYRPGAGKFMPEDIDASLCTHIIYAFAKLQGNKLKAFEWNDESTPWMKGMYEKFHDTTKAKNPNVKLQLAVGGWNMGSGTFTAMVRTAASRHEFATTSVKFLRDHGFDGLDMDWEYPAGRGSPPQDKQNFVELIKEIKRVFEQDAQSTGRTRLIISSAIPAGKPNIDPGYDIPALSKELDFMNLMAYDLHGSWETHVGENDPLYAMPSEHGDDRTLNVDWAAKYWVSKGADKSKINIGMGTYGRSFTLTSTSNTEPYAPARGKGQAGQFTREGGFLAYYEICNMINSGGTVHQNKQQMVPYVVKGNQWIGYDDEASIRQKVRYAKTNGFGGVMVWAMDLDDFHGNSCGKGRYPLLRAVNSECGATGGVLNTPAPVVTTQQPVHHGSTSHPQQTTSHHNNIKHSQDFVCSGKKDGFYASPYDCSEYYICAGQTAYKTVCATGLIFNANTAFCDKPENYHCTVGQTHTQAPQHTNWVTHTAAPTHQTQAPYTQQPHTQAPHHTNSPGTVDINNFCKTLSDGIHEDPTDCHHFFDCAMHRTYRIPCAPGTGFNPSINTCDNLYNLPNCH